MKRTHERRCSAEEGRGKKWDKIRSVERKDGWGEMHKSKEEKKTRGTEEKLGREKGFEKKKAMEIR